MKPLGPLRERRDIRRFGDSLLREAEFTQSADQFVGFRLQFRIHFSGLTQRVAGFAVEVHRKLTYSGDTSLFPDWVFPGNMAGMCDKLLDR